MFTVRLMSDDLDFPLLRGRIARSGKELTIALPAPTTAVLKFFIVLWMAAIAGMGTAMIGSARQTADVVFLAIFFGSMLLIGSYMLLWALFGRELIHVSGDTMRISRQILGIATSSATYDLRRVGELRIDPQDVASPNHTQGDLSAIGRFWGMSGGTLAFQYGAREYRFAINASPGDAHTILANIRAVAPGGIATQADRAASENREARVIERGRGIMIDVPPARDPAVTRFLGFWLLVNFGILAAATFLEVQSDEMTRVAFPILLTLFIGGGLYLLAMNLWRRETISVDDRVIVIDRSLFGLHTRERIQIRPEAKLEVDPDFRYELRAGSRRGVSFTFSSNVGPIVYRENHVERRFGEGLTPAEAAWLVERVHAKSPSLVD